MATAEKERTQFEIDNDSLGDQKAFTQKQANIISGDLSRPSKIPLSEEELVQGAIIPCRANTLAQLLSSTTVENLLNGGNLVSLSEDSTIEEALKMFKDTEVQAIPLYDSKEKFSRILDIRDIFYYFCLCKHEDLELFFQRTVKDLFGTEPPLRSRETKMMPLGTLLSEAVKILSTGIHHIGVLDDATGSIFNIISQLSVIKFIAKNISLVPRDLRLLPVNQFMRQMVHVKNIPSDTSTRESFEYLFTDDVSAAAVVNYITGDIMDTVSTFDLVGVVHDRFKYLDRTVIDFLYATRRTKALKPPITCKLEDTLEYVVLKLASTGVHRLWVVDSANQLRYLGVASLTDVLKAIAQSLE